MQNFNLKPVGKSFNADLANAAKSLGTGEVKALVGLLGNVNHAMHTGDIRPLHRLVTGEYGFSPMVLDRMVKIMRDCTASLKITKGDDGTVTGIKIAKQGAREWKDEAAIYFKAADEGKGIFHPLIGGRPAAEFDLAKRAKALAEAAVKAGLRIEDEHKFITACVEAFRKAVPTQNVADGTPAQGEVEVRRIAA